MNCRLSVRRIDPVENCLDIPRFNCAATFSMIDDESSSRRSIRDQNHIASFGKFVNLVEEDETKKRKKRMKG